MQVGSTFESFEKKTLINFHLNKKAKRPVLFSNNYIYSRKFDITPLCNQAWLIPDNVSDHLYRMVLNSLPT